MNAPDRFVQLESDIAAERRAVLEHPLYGEVNDLWSLRVFMASHAFAVWDFMSLLKSLQQRLTCVSVPWLPAKDTFAARLINEIVLGEETDEIRPGEYVSHYDLYLQAMGEVDADDRLVREFVDSLQSGFPFKRVMEGMPVVKNTRQFVEGTLLLCQTGTHVQVAASFLLGREDLVPQMFQRFVAELERSGMPCESFRLYLDRHIEVDSESHGPMARRLLSRLCGSNERTWQEATLAARAALLARKSLWDGVLGLIQHRES
jgi:hypothetical protein